jgi:prolyl oligopeptidase
VRDAGGRTRTLLDPVSFDQNQSHAAINYFAPSPEGRYVAVGVSLGGSEDATLHIIDTAAAKLLPDAITRTQYAGPSWTPDSKALYYARLQKLAPGAPPTAIYENERTFPHTLGADPETDPAVFGHDVASSPDMYRPRSRRTLSGKRLLRKLPRSCPKKSALPSPVNF